MRKTDRWPLLFMMVPLILILISTSVYGEEAGKGPHGGQLISVGDGINFLEIVHEPDQGRLTLYPLAMSDGRLVGVSRRRRNIAVNIETDSGPKQLMAMGKGGWKTRQVFRITHEALKKSPLRGNIRYTCRSGGTNQDFFIDLKKIGLKSE